MNTIDRQIAMAIQRNEVVISKEAREARRSVKRVLTDTPAAGSGTTYGKGHDQMQAIYRDARNQAEALEGRVNRAALANDLDEIARIREDAVNLKRVTAQAHKDANAGEVTYTDRGPRIRNLPGANIAAKVRYCGANPNQHRWLDDDTNEIMFLSLSDLTNPETVRVFRDRICPNKGHEVISIVTYPDESQNVVFDRGRSRYREPGYQVRKLIILST